MDHEYIRQVQSGQASLQRVFYVIDQVRAGVVQTLGQNDTLRSNGEAITHQSLLQMPLEAVEMSAEFACGMT